MGPGGYKEKRKQRTQKERKKKDRKEIRFLMIGSGSPVKMGEKESEEMGERKCGL